MFTIYGLIDPLDPKTIRYVGATKHRLRDRVRGHNNQRGADARTEWVLSVLAEGRRVEGVVLATTPSEREAYRLETVFIERNRQTVTNAKTGGRIGFRFFTDARSKMSESARGNSNRRGKKAGAETRERLRAAHVGLKHSKATRRLMSALRRGRPISEKQRIGIQRYAISAEGRAARSRGMKAVWAARRAAKEK